MLVNPGSFAVCLCLDHDIKFDQVCFCSDYPIADGISNTDALKLTIDIFPYLDYGSQYAQDIRVNRGKTLYVQIKEEDPRVVGPNFAYILLPPPPSHPPPEQTQFNYGPDGVARRKICPDYELGRTEPPVHDPQVRQVRTCHGSGTSSWAPPPPG